jgi:hypothetical protein
VNFTEMLAVMMDYQDIAKIDKTTLEALKFHQRTGVCTSPMQKKTDITWILHTGKKKNIAQLGVVQNRNRHLN